MTDDLIKRLRELPRINAASRLCRDASDALEQQAKRIAELKASIQCANCGQSLGGVERPAIIGGTITEGEAVCSIFCLNELEERGCPQEHDGQYRDASWYAYRAEKAEADLAAARAAINALVGKFGKEAEKEYPEHAPAIAAARGEGGE
jgi:hypothetical protein